MENINKHPCIGFPNDTSLQGSKVVLEKEEKKEGNVVRGIKKEGEGGVRDS